MAVFRVYINDMISNNQQAEGEIDLNSALSRAIAQENTMSHARSIDFEQLGQLPYTQRFSFSASRQLVSILVGTLLLILVGILYQFNQNSSPSLSLSEPDNTVTQEPPKIEATVDNTPLTPLWKLDVPRAEGKANHPLFTPSFFEDTEHVSLRRLFDETNLFYPNRIGLEYPLAKSDSLEKGGQPVKTRQQYQREWAARQQRNKSKKVGKGRQYYLTQWKIQQAQLKKRAQWEFKKTQLKKQKAEEVAHKKRQRVRQLEDSILEEVDW